MKENIQIQDLTVVGAVAETIILCVLKGDEEKTNPRAIQYNLGNNSFYIDTTEKFMKFTVFEPVDIHNPVIQEFYQGWIYRKLTNEKFVRSLIEFTPEEGFNADETPIQKAYLAGIIGEDQIEKAWKKHPIGTVTTRKDGQQYRKVSETGNTEQDWQPVKRGNAPAKKEETGDKGAPAAAEGEAKPTGKELKDFATNTTQEALENTIKQSPDPELRKIAHDELDRRTKEEDPAYEEEIKAKEEAKKEKEADNKKAESEKEKDNKDKDTKTQIKKGYQQWL